MDEKKKVLISFVGMRDPYSEGKAKRFLRKIKGQETFSEGSVLTTCRKLKPDIVYLLPSSKEKAAQTNTPENHTEDKAYAAQKILTQQLGISECNVMPLMTDNATDYTQLYTCLRNNMRKIFNNLAKNYPGEQDCINQKYELIFILASGTQQMNQTAQLYLQTVPYEFKYYRGLEPRHAKDGERVIPVQLTVNDETLLLKSIEANVEGYYFHSVIENCERLSQISIIEQRRRRALTMKAIFSAYEYIDLMQYKEAHELLEGAFVFFSKHKDKMLENNPALPIENVCEVLGRQVDFLKLLKEKVDKGDEGEDENNLIDLYYNMLRAYAQGNYADVLSRFWRLREGTMNYRLLLHYCIDRRNLNRKFTDEAKEKKRVKAYNELLNSRYADKVDWNNGWVRNDIGALSSLLTGFCYDNPTREFERRFNDQLENLRNIRNRTIVAHGMLPVSKENADYCVTLGKEIVNLIPRGERVSKSYPFKLEDMREVLNLLKYI
ncbi:MAG: hypothetical protein IJ597_05030 [Synergistaceae bacterium]|nr:hypothetical protein [Synergistaceae bacterium]